MGEGENLPLPPTPLPTSEEEGEGELSTATSARFRALTFRDLPVMTEPKDLATAFVGAR